MDRSGVGWPAGRRDDTGSVTAELAIGMAALMLVLAFGSGLLQLGQARLQAGWAAASAARLLARDEPPAAVQARLRSVAADLNYSVRHEQEHGFAVTTVSVWREVPVAGVGRVTIRARASAVDEADEFGALPQAGSP